MSKPDRRPRPRRIAADEAHSWARNLKLGNIHAKLILSMVTLYVDVEGVCFVSIPSLAEDCEMSPDTVRKRLAWLEQIGAISRTGQWIDENGNRNSLGKGKRTTDLIRLLYEADTAIIEARAVGDFDDDTAAEATAFSPSCQQGLNSEPETVSPRPGLGQPSHCSKGLISEPEPKSSPLPPSRGRESSEVDRVESEPEHFAPAWAAWRGHEVMRRDLALHEFRRLAASDQRLCRAAIFPYQTALEKSQRTKHRENFHLWIRRRGFDEFPTAKIVELQAPPVRRWLCGDELVGMEVAGVMADRRGRFPIDPERGAGFWTQMAHRADLVALAAFQGQRASEWIEVEQGSAQFAAWSGWLQQVFGGDEVKGQRVWTEPHDPLRHDIPAISPNFAFRKWKQVLRVPAPWPPRRDGTWTADEGTQSDGEWLQDRRPCPHGRPIGPQRPPGLGTVNQVFRLTRGRSP